ncbi:acyl-CoA thioesterase [Nocardia sp. 004]|uniref:acyl-CoA thioesterase n=1 Tax=Nocardia sp. 004 TaxID=3385978 RepID=UPI0039A1CB0D
MTRSADDQGKRRGSSALPKRFHTKVSIRWSDIDAFQHVNHARMVALLEEARNLWLFEDNRPTAVLRMGCALTELRVHYTSQLRHEDTPLDIAMWVEQLRAIDFTIGFEVHGAGAELGSPPAVTASTRMAAFDMMGQRARRLTDDERAYLSEWME